MNLVVLWSARVCREGWDKSMFGQLETEQEAEEGQPWLQGERKETQMCPAVRLSGQQNTAHPSWVVSVSQSALAACQEGRSPHPDRVSAAGERKWASKCALAHSHAPCWPASVAKITSGSARKPDRGEQCTGHFQN